MYQAEGQGFRGRTARDSKGEIREYPGAYRGGQTQDEYRGEESIGREGLPGAPESAQRRKGREAAGDYQQGNYSTRA